MVKSGITNAQLPTSILTDALAEKVGNARSPEVMRHVLLRLESEGWTFRRHDEAMKTDELRQALLTARAWIHHWDLGRADSEMTTSGSLRDALQIVDAALAQRAA